MARKVQSMIIVAPDLSGGKAQRIISRLEQRISELRAFDPLSSPRRWGSPEVTALEARIKATLASAFGEGTVAYKRYEAAGKLDNGLPVMRIDGGEEDPAIHRQDLANGIVRSIGLLNSAITQLREEYGDDAPAELPSSPAQKVKTRKIFIVHGHEEGPREAVAGFLRKIDFNPVILHERTNQGRTIVEKFEENSDVDFAVVLLTPDDIGAAKDQEPQPRARQNVILELGYFIGKLGRKNVCAIKQGDLEIPSDILGVVWTPYDANGAWKIALARELKDAGHEVDWNKAMA